MIITILCSRKVFNIWASIIIVCCFLNKFPGPLIGFVFLVFLICKNLAQNIDSKHKEKVLKQTGVFPLETIFSIALALNKQLEDLNKSSENSLFISTYKIFLSDLESNFPTINFTNQIPYDIEDIKPAMKYLEEKIAFIKNQVNQNNKNILETQINAYFVLLVFCYNKIYKDLNNITLELLEKLK